MKYLLKMAFRNIGRNKRRTALSAIAISIAVMIVLVMRGYIGGTVDSMFDSLTRIEAGHIKITHPEYNRKADMMPLEYMVNGFDGGSYKQLIPVLESVQGIKIIAPRIKLGVLLSFGGKSQSAMGMGVDPKTEGAITSFDRIMVDGNYLGANENARSMIIGDGLAGKLRIKPGDKLTIVARTANDSLRGMTFNVSGIFRYGISVLDGKLFYIPIGAAARLLEMGDGVSELILMVDKPENAEKIAGAVKEKLGKRGGSNPPQYDVIPWQKQEGYLSMIKSAMPIYNAVYLGLLILASTVIINTTMMVIFERTREIGTIGALGMTGGQIVLLFTTEATIVSAIGSFMGMVVGGGLDLLLSIMGINVLALTGGSKVLPMDVIYPRFGLSLLFWSFIFGIVVASAFAYIPARRAARVEPAEALRSI